ncbi:MAG: nucleotidyltransferase family protein [Lachnospiraceae bacterium]|nr:nucleotidyltransferase family protein [Lachnospiraceae bacterium]
MKTAAIIAEYNPFHAGHKYQIEETRRLTDADYILIIMSGDFVQRGAPAIYNKYIRTQMALMGGADAVIELPVLYAVSSAEYFAGGSIALLNQLGVTDYLSFGSECGDIELIKSCSELLFSDDPDYNNALSSFMKQGLSFPVARNKAVLQTALSSDNNYPENDLNQLFASPNNILALEYCKALLATNSSIIPVTVKRQGDPYHETAVNEDPAVFSSASAIRNVIEHNPGHRYDNTAAINDLPSHFLACDDFSLLLYYKLLTEREYGFTKYLDCSHDLSFKIIKNLFSFTDFTGFCSLLKSKDITYTRISRVLTHILLGITTPDSFQYPISNRDLPVPYARLLGFKKSSSDLLSSIKKNSSIPLISKLADASSLLSDSAFTQLKQDILASDIYESVFANKYKKEMLNEYKQSPLIL